VAPLEDDPSRFRLILACVATLGAVLVLLLVGAGRSRPVQSVIIAVAAGLCYAISAAMIKLTGFDLVHEGVAATARDWPGYALAGFTVLGLVLGQGAYAAGSLPPALATMSITNPVASYLLGVYAFGATPPEGAGSLAALAGAGALICLGAIGLVYSPMVRRDSSTDQGSPA
jgi:hypothetical protein